MTVFSKILIANRGEIAARVIKTACKLGYRTVAVYSEADSNSLHSQLADEAVCIGPSPVGQSYLVAEKIIAAAKKSGADAIHPGYGFLSENADFAQLCIDNHITFIGPSPHAIELMGSKRLSKIAMMKAGVPCIPGFLGNEVLGDGALGNHQDPQLLTAEAMKIGLPVMIKASAGGGGRGMRLVFKESELAENIKSAKSEAESAFGNGELILEKAVVEPRHIEIQIFADQQGNTIYLGERDCSIQRRHQKVVEEAPSPALNESLRQRMGKAAVNAAKSCQYVGAGTVEFLLDGNNNFYFLEMNTRLQVEHPVTEMITGTDLVEWQLRIASGEDLPLTQEQVQLNGHAIEVRLYAEDPSKRFTPQTGPVLQWSFPTREGVRIDHGISEGSNISPYYDPMLAKIIAHGKDRHEANRRLISALKDTVLLGVNTNKEFLIHVLSHPSFKAGEATTAFIEKQFDGDATLQTNSPPSIDCAIAGTLIHILSQQNNSPIDNFISWRTDIITPTTIKLTIDDYHYVVQLKALIASENKYCVTVELNQSTSEHNIQILYWDNGVCTYLVDNLRQRINYAIDGENISIDTSLGNRTFCNATQVSKTNSDLAGDGIIKAPMDGALIEINVKTGEKVKKGQTVARLEAMKMEHPLKADIDGTIETISGSVGDQVKNKQCIIVIDSEA